MKKIKMQSMALALCLLAGLVFTGCSAPTADNSASTPGNGDQQAMQPAANGSSDAVTKDSNEAPGNGQGKGNFARPDLMGEVSKVEGNVVTLKVIEMPKFGGRNKGNGSTDNQKPAPSSDDASKKSDQPRQMEVKFTGATEAITIPKEVQVEKTVRTDSGRKTEVVALKDLAVGEILQITYSDKEKKIPSKISVRPQRPQQPQQ